ncbi:probable transcriptional regulator [Oceanicola granulosus HTCC2516]|uniref:Probable transcriptional regulator n=1 Tax=Oceanicola granulosus (strain ATCC BAA-861 / DSM 15982 / KCTC 12143 / HTCC2516) TaxID=314256 RepID=Q2CF51_OCEGH|nr:BTAD domain-containing putative transcriptional regulator [Oceanicola granulosus]EAR51276.1 probable transcriptional regulator [Oceanicola granulosus HTCC2516]
MSCLRLTLLGPFALATAAGAPIRIDTRKARALLAVLAMANSRPLARERLASLLWSRGSTRQSLASLSQALYSLRRALGEAAPALVVSAETVALAMDRVSVDALELEAAASEGGAAGWRRNLALYAGPFLDDLSIDTEDGYREWRQQERARLEAIATGAGTALMNAWEHAPDEADPALVDRLLQIDPYNEPATRVKMRCLALEGRSAAAIEALEAMTARLEEDLAVAPSEASLGLAEEIRSGSLAPRAGAVARGVPSGRSATGPLVAIAVTCVLLLSVLLLRDPLPRPDSIRLLVRPFHADSGMTEDLATGFADDLATELVRRASLHVLSRESGRLVPVGGEARTAASHVLEGRVRAVDEGWTINLWITELSTGREVWAERFEGSAGDPRLLRDEIVAELGERIGIALRPAADLPATTLTDAAMPAYLRALARLHSGTPEGNAEAMAALEELAQAHPAAPEPAAALALAYERIAFGADAHARAAGLHWREGYLLLKWQLARTEADHPGLLAARARLALRRLDHAEAEILARQALASESAHVAALEVLAESLALTGDTGEARRLATRAVLLSPSAPAGGYTAIALATFAEGDLAAAADAVAMALDGTASPSPRLLALAAAIRGLGPDAPRARAAFADLVAASESRPFGAWRLGDITYTNPRAATWSRPTGTDAAQLIRFADPAVDALLRSGLARAAGEAASTAPARSTPLEGGEIEELLMNARIVGRPSWLARQSWSQIRTASGHLEQRGPLGPLPAAREGRSRIVDSRLCDRWTWRDSDLESCQLVVRTGLPGTLAMIGEIGVFPFVAPD